MIAKTLSLFFLGILSLFALISYADQNKYDKLPLEYHQGNSHTVHSQLGPRPFFLVRQMDEGPLKEKLSSCDKGPFKKTEFSIGHRGAPMQFPEHTLESYQAAAEMGAGIIECDVTFTSDRELVCRHSQCDLHTTTNILSTALASKCTTNFIPAKYDSEGKLADPAQARCCTSDITLAEFKTLKGKMDAYNPQARTVEDYMKGTPSWRTDLYVEPGTLLTHKESIALFKSLGVKMTPELKSPSVKMPWQGDYSQQDFAQQMIDEYKQMDVTPKSVFPQSFNLDDINYWLQQEPEFGQQAVYLDGRYEDPSFDHTNPATWSPTMAELVAQGVKIIAPPMWMLLRVDSEGQVIASIYANAAKSAGLDIITWTLERDGPLAGGGGWYHQSIASVINNDGDTMQVLDVLAKEVGVIGVFSDWPATTSYYANCMNLK